MKKSEISQDIILEHIRLVGENSKNCNLSNLFCSKFAPSLNKISAYFGTTTFQSLFLANVITKNFSEKAAEFLDLAEYFGCTPLQLLTHKAEINELVTRRILSKVKNENSKFMLSLPSSASYYVRQDICDAILNNGPLPDLSLKNCKDSLELLENLYTLGCDRKNENISTDILFEKSTILIKQCIQFPLVRRLLKLKLSNENNFLLCYLLWKYLNGSTSIDLETAINAIFDDKRRRVDYRTELFLAIHPLINNGFIVIEKSRLYSDSSILLQDKALDLLESEYSLYTKGKKSNDNILIAKEIAHKKLFFNQIVSDQLSQLQQALSEKNLKKIQNRMKHKGHPTGLTVLFFGDSGTGKTESVYQVAHKTNREIMKVDISESKSKWFGESERMARKIFTDYYTYLKEHEICPILLVNEADGLFSKRKEFGTSSVDQTENTIQNIFLQELESFTGILIATTNLAGNFDHAFDRRFLYKIKFTKPDLSIRSRIWESKLPGYFKKEYDQLSEQFEFSGAQIDNIVRKLEINSILKGRRLDFSHVLSYCNEELAGKSNYQKIGFRA